ncbi:hypothetical protein [Selenomonas ruminantium]|uniref:Uncharacterized protein n=1 Tax=Selenomonas ruminantium TaxID=971 RepID=A0A1H3YXI4_SELRU|nr:hypothetical protein [Selenomonas ruminantium]SEA16273.1 hypothetical protein SAMN05660648_02197 [Selenomonas ruminantium]
MRHTKKNTLQITRITGSDETGKDIHSYLNLAHVNSARLFTCHRELLALNIHYLLIVAHPPIRQARAQQGE